MPAEAAESPRTQPPRRKRLLTLGGCNAIEISKHLVAHYDHTHIWNVTWPSLGSPPFPLIRKPDSPRLSHLNGFIHRETNKTYADTISRGGFDIITLSSGQNILNDFVVLGELCIPDFTAPFYLSDAALAGEPRPSIHDFVGNAPRVVRWLDEGYLEIVQAGFARAYHKLLKPRIDAGALVIVHHHVLAQEILTPDGVVPNEDFATKGRSALIAKMVDYARGFPGIHILEQIPELNYTSADAIGGLWAFHPIDEQYLGLALKIARLAGDDIGDQMLNRFLLDSRKRKLVLDGQLDQSASRERDLTAVSTSLAFRAARLEQELQATRKTLSWRITWPLRAVRRRMRRTPQR